MEGLRVNAILKEDESRKISLVAAPKTTVARLKRLIEEEFAELLGLNVLVSVLEDERGFVLSNNSTIGEHLRHGDPVYVQLHREKEGVGMNLPNSASQLFMTLRFVCGSVLRKLEAGGELDPLEVLPELLHLGFWYANAEAVGTLCRLLDRVLTPEALERYYRHAHDMQNLLLLKLLAFWLADVANSLASFPEVAEHLLGLLYKLSLTPGYAQLLRGHPLMKNIVAISKDPQLGADIKRMALMTVRNVTGKGTATGLGKTASAYIPTALAESTTSLSASNIEEVLDGLCSGSQEVKRQALSQLASHPKLIAQACVRFDYFFKLTSVFTLRCVKDKPTAKVFAAVVREMTAHTTREKGKEIMQKDIVRKVHSFLLDSHPDAHAPAIEFYSAIAKESAARGVFNVEQAGEVIGSPYLEFQRVTVEALAEASEREKQASPIRFLPSIKDYLRLALKTEDGGLAAAALRLTANLTLDDQCRYQINNLKGIEIFVKFLEDAQRQGNAELQRTCAKALLNLSLASREVKAKVLSLLPAVLDRFYKGALDAVAGSYIENLLKSAKG